MDNRTSYAAARVALVCATTWAFALPASAAENFPSPEAAVEALITAVRAGDANAAIGLFGEENQDLLLTGVDEVDRQSWAAFSEAFDISSRIVVDADTASLYIGTEQWPFPVSIRKTGDTWEFDTAAARDEILYRRIGENELTALDVLNSYIVAQYEYFAQDRDGDDVLEFAQFVLSADNARDGLYYPVSEGEDESPFGAAIAVASLEGYSYAVTGRTESPDPYYGYFFKVLTRQGDDAPGGAFDYVINGNMVAGFGMIAFPADYGVSGVMSFMIGRNGEIYERDLGTATLSLASEIHAFDPGPEWTAIAKR